MERHDSLAKVGWMLLILLPESNNTNTDFSQKMIGYQMYGTCARFILRYLLSSLALGDPILSVAFFLTAVMGVEMAKTNTSFITPGSSSENTCWQTGLSFYNGSI